MQFNKILLLTSALLVTGVNHEVYAVDDFIGDPTKKNSPRDINISIQPNEGNSARESAIQQAIAILDNNLHTLKTAYTLCFDAANTLLGKTDKPLSE